ncbi:MAG: hypothetical protein ACM30G_00520, partial [Micromonosporaceae bacterium]
MGDGDETVAPEASDLDNKLKLVEFSYGEVLDATKHQDDKIGRMLTSVAFLTAAVLSLAGMKSAEFITRRFTVEPFEIPLGLYCLAAFLVGIVFTVVLLLTSLATPLRVPGLGQVDRSQRSSVGAAGGVRASQLYFYSISNVSLAEWETKWEAPAEDLKQERLGQLISETHNLGIRTTFKYDRSTEAVSFLSFSLLAFGLAVLFSVTAGAADHSGPIELRLSQQFLIGTLLACYCALQLLAQIRYARQAVDEEPPGGQRLRRLRTWSERVFVVSFALLVCDLVLDVDEAWRQVWSTTLVALAVISATAFCIAASGGSARSQRRSGRRRRVFSPVTMVLAQAALVTAVFWCADRGWYAYQLLAAVLVVLGLNLLSALNPTLSGAQRRRAYRQRLADAAAA